MGTVVNLPHNQLNMKVMGFVVLALACCLLSVSGAPSPIVDPVSVAFTAAGGLVLTAGTATPPSRPPLSWPARPSSSRGWSSTSCSLRRPKKGTGGEQHQNVKILS